MGRSERRRSRLATDHFHHAVRTDALGPVRGTALDGLAGLSVRDDPMRAMRLLGAATSLRERDGGQPPAWLRRRGAAIRVQAEAHLSGDAARQAWEHGRSMSTEQAIAYALSPPPEPRSAASLLDQAAAEGDRPDVHAVPGVLRREWG